MTTSGEHRVDPRWGAWGARVADAMSSLGPDGFLVTQGPAKDVDAGPGLLGRRRRPVSVRPEVAALRLSGRGIFVRSVLVEPGARDFPIDAYARRAMRGAGWLVPEDEAYFTTGDRWFTALLDEGDHGGVARLAARTYPILGVTDPDEVEVEAVDAGSAGTRKSTPYDRWSRRQQLWFVAGMTALTLFTGLVAVLGLAADREEAESGDFVATTGVVESTDYRRTGTNVYGTVCTVRFATADRELTESMGCSDATSRNDRVTVYYLPDRPEGASLRTPEEAAANVTVGQWLFIGLGALVLGTMASFGIKAWRRPKEEQREHPPAPLWGSEPL